MMDCSKCESEQYRLQGVEVTGRTFGSGSCTNVMEVRYMGLTCAAKKFHFTRHQDYKSIEDEYCKRYHEHCCLLGKLRHPNLVQFIGFYCEPDCLTPILVYESQHTNLANCIDRHSLLPDSINYSVLKDVAIALRYLHEFSSPIAHRSLRASKVLLTRDMSAKLADVGAATKPDADMSSFVPHRENEDVELVNDIYAFGLLMIHVITGRSLRSEIASLQDARCASLRDARSTSFHDARSASLQDARFMSFQDARSASLQDARSAFFNESDLVEELLIKLEGHLLRDLMSECLHSEPHSRPSAITLSQKMAQVSANHPPLFSDSLEMLQQIKADARRQLNMKRRLSSQLSAETQYSELDRLKALVSKISTQNMVLQARLNSRNSSICSENESSMATHGKGLMRQENQCINSPLQIRQGHLEWTECRDLPVGMFQGQAVYLKGKIYVGGGSTGDAITDALVFEYNPQKDVWAPLPPTYLTSFGLCKLEGEIVVVGGEMNSKVTGTVGVFDSFSRRWKESLPPLENARRAPSCVSTFSAIIVAGGVSPAGEFLSSVEVIKSDTFQWYTAGYLPLSAILCHSSPAVISNTIYLMGGYKSSTADSSSRITHSSSANLLLSCHGMTPNTWSSIPATPHFQSTAVGFGSCLLALGGTSSAYSDSVHRSIHAFSHSANSWVYVGDLPYGFCHGIAISLPNNELYVMGGWTQPGKLKRSCKVYKASITINGL